MQIKNVLNTAKKIMNTTHVMKRGTSSGAFLPKNDGKKIVSLPTQYIPKIEYLRNMDVRVSEKNGKSGLLQYVEMYQLSEVAKSLALKGAEGSFAIGKEIATISSETNRRSIGTHIGGFYNHVLDSKPGEFRPYQSPYPSNEVKGLVKARLSDVYAGINFELDQFSWGVSQKESLHIALELLYSKSDTVLITVPLYPTVKNKLEQIGCQIIVVDVLKEGERAVLDILKSNTKITGYYHERNNPLSCGSDFEEELASIASDRKLKVVVDLAYNHVNPKNEKPYNPFLAQLSSFGPSIACASLSKLTGQAGWRRCLHVSSHPHVTRLHEEYVNQLKSCPETPTEEEVMVLMKNKELFLSSVEETRKVYAIAESFSKGFQRSEGIKKYFDMIERKQGPFLTLGVAKLCLEVGCTSEALYKALLIVDKDVVIGSQPNGNFHSNFPFLRFSAGMLKNADNAYDMGCIVANHLSDPKKISEAVRKVEEKEGDVNRYRLTNSERKQYQDCVDSPLFLKAFSEIMQEMVVPVETMLFQSGEYSGRVVIGMGAVGWYMVSRGYLDKGVPTCVVTDHLNATTISVEGNAIPVKTCSMDAFVMQRGNDPTPITFELCTSSGEPTEKKVRALLDKGLLRKGDSIVIAQNSVFPESSVLKVLKNSQIGDDVAVAHLILSVGIVLQDKDNEKQLTIPFNKMHQLYPVHGDADWSNYASALENGNCNQVKVFSYEEGKQLAVEKRMKNNRNFVDSIAYMRQVLDSSFQDKTPFSYGDGLKNEFCNQASIVLTQECLGIYLETEEAQVSRKEAYNEMQLKYADTTHISSTVSSMHAMLMGSGKRPELGLVEESVRIAEEKGVDATFNRDYLELMQLFIRCYDLGVADRLKQGDEPAVYLEFREKLHSLESRLIQRYGAYSEQDQFQSLIQKISKKDELV